MNTSEKKRILITVKTYPTLSKKYGETVCTAGIQEDGTWVRLYPVPFRRLGQQEQYSKFDWIECGLSRHSRDPRPESFRPINEVDLQSVSHIGTSNNWRERRRIILENAPVYDRLDDLISGAKKNIVSLATFKPTRLLDFVHEDEEREWDPKRLQQMRPHHDQLEMFSDNEWRRTFKIIPKLPYSFSYRFEDSTGRTSKLQILDWEIGALYWNCLRQSQYSEPEALEKVTRKYFSEFREKDLHFFVGTTQRWHNVALNPWVIVGVFPIPYDAQGRLL